MLAPSAGSAVRWRACKTWENDTCRSITGRSRRVLFIYQRKGGEMTLAKARRSRLAYLVAALALALSLVVIVPAPADAGVTCSNTFHFHGTGYWHERYYTYPSGNGWIWGWRNQNYDFIGSIWCGSQNP